MQNFQTSLDTIGNNIANSDTTGYKSSRANFADALSDTLQGATASTSTTGGIIPVQLGTGVMTTSVESEFTQGAVNSTGVATDMAISGGGFFYVKDPSTQATYLTRAGDFITDSSGYLTTTGGLRVQGYTDSTLTTVGDIKIDTTGASSSTATLSSYTFDSQGKITVTMSDNSTFVRGQVLLMSVQNPNALVKYGDNLYAGIDQAGPLGGAGSATPASPKTNGLGEIRSKSLEASNVDLAAEFADMITAQRGFQANARVITTSDEMLQDIVGLKR